MFEASNAKTGVEEWDVKLNFPFVFNEKTVLLTGLAGNRTHLNLDANVPATLNVLSLNLGLNRVFNEMWSATFMVFPKIASDEIKLSSDHLQLAFLALLTQKKRDNLKFRYGMYTNTEKYGLIVVPILGLYYLSADKRFEADLNLPIIADINYSLHPRTWIGLKFDGLGTTYNLNDQNYDVQGAYVSKTSNELLSYLRFQLHKSIYVNAKIGYAISRNYRIFSADDKIDWALIAFYFGDNRTQLNDRFKDGALFKLELVYRLHFEKINKSKKSKVIRD